MHGAAGVEAGRARVRNGLCSAQNWHCVHRHRACQGEEFVSSIATKRTHHARVALLMHAAWGRALPGGCKRSAVCASRAGWRNPRALQLLCTAHKSLLQGKPQGAEQGTCQDGQNQGRQAVAATATADLLPLMLPHRMQALLLLSC